MARCRFSSDFLGIVCSVRLAFSNRAWPYVTVAAFSWLLCARQRSITRLADPRQHRRSLSSYYRFLSDGKWRLEVFFRSLFDLILTTFCVKALTLVVDDTLCPKWGHGIFGTGTHFDHVKRPRAGYIWGHNWIVLAVVVQVDTIAWVALPFWISLYRPERRCRRKEFRTRHQLVAVGLRLVRTWFSGKIALLADGAYNNASILSPCAELQIPLISRIRADARIRLPNPPKRRKDQKGRNPDHGAWLPRPSVLAKDLRKFVTQQVTIYGKKVTLRMREMIIYWPACDTTVKLVIIRDPHHRRRTTYLTTTDLHQTAAEVVTFFARRWSIEHLFSIAKLQMGLDSAEVRKERSVLRHAAFCMSMITWVEVWAHRFWPSRRARSFTQKLAALREDTVAQTIFASAPRTRATREMVDTIANLFSIATKGA